MILDSIQFWKILETIIYMLTGIQADRKMGYNDYKDIHTYMHKNSKMKCPEMPKKSDVEHLKKILAEYKSCKI